MGEIADLIIDGEICQTCMCELGEAVGYPRYCEECKKQFAPKYQCTACRKFFNSKQAVIQHIGDSHGKLG